MKLGFPISAISAAATAQTIGVTGLAAVFLCVAGWVLIKVIDARVTLYQAQLEAFPDLMRRRLETSRRLRSRRKDRKKGGPRKKAR